MTSGASMHVTILGSGTAYPLRDRSAPGLAVRIGTTLLLLDMGPGSLRQMVRAGLSHARIDHVFLTHLHPDHTAGLVHFLFATRDPEVLARRTPLAVTGPPGLRLFLERLQAAFDPWLNLPPHLLAVGEWDPAAEPWRDYGTFRAGARPMRHGRPSQAYRLESPQGASLVYSGDTETNPDIEELARGADVLILECSLPDNAPRPGHLTPSEAGRIAARAGVGRLVLVHFYPTCLRTDITAQCRRTYSGELTLGSDLLEIRLA